MSRSVLGYGVAVAAGAFVLRWLEYQYAVRVFSTEIYVTGIALAFGGLGLWVGWRVATRSNPVPFVPNHRAIDSLGLSPRECEVLALLAQGHTNQEIATRLFVSANTVKSHLGRVYDKLGVSRRTQAVQRARALHLIP